MKNEALLSRLKGLRDGRRLTLENKAYQSLDTASVVRTEDSDLVGTRLEDGEPSVTVLLVKSFDPVGKVLETVQGETLSATMRVREGASVVLRSSVSVASSKAPPNTLDELAFLKPFAYTGRRKDDGTEVVALRIGVVVKGKVLDILGRPLKEETFYSSQTGYTFIRKERT